MTLRCMSRARPRIAPAVLTKILKISRSSPVPSQGQFRSGAWISQGLPAIVETFADLFDRIRSGWNVVFELDRCRKDIVMVSHQPQRGGQRRIPVTPGEISLSVTQILAILQMHAVDARMVLTDEGERIVGVCRDEPPEV